MSYAGFEIGDVIKIKSVYTHISPVNIWHYGIVVDNGEVVHFNLSDGHTHIIKTSLRKFVGLGSNLKRCLISEEYRKFSRRQVADRALSQVGSDFGGYDLFKNNCEHFANWCISGDRFSTQILTDEGEHNTGAKIADKAFEPAFDFLDELDRKTDAFFDKLDNIADWFRKTF